jgi:hypothetical protein
MNLIVEGDKEKEEVQVDEMIRLARWQAIRIRFLLFLEEYKITMSLIDACAAILDKAIAKKASLKTLVYADVKLDKKQAYALINNVLKFRPVLEEIIEKVLPADQLISSLECSRRSVLLQRTMQF